jgi:hypothetical protein
VAVEERDEPLARVPLLGAVAVVVLAAGVERVLDGLEVCIDELAGMVGAVVEDGVLPRDLGHVEEPQVERVEDLVLHVVLKQRSAVGAGGHVVMGAGSVASTL